MSRKKAKATADNLPQLPRTYSHSLVMRIAALVFLLLVLAAMGMIAYNWITQERVVEALPPDLSADRPDWSETTLGVGAMGAILFLLAILALYLVLLSVSFNRRIRVDVDGIARLSLFGTRRINWTDVKELTLGGNTPFAEGAMGTKLFIEAADRTLITFTNRLRHVGELVDIIEAKTHSSFGATKDETIEPLPPDPPLVLEDNHEGTKSTKN